VHVPWYVHDFERAAAAVVKVVAEGLNADDVAGFAVVKALAEGLNADDAAVEIEVMVQLVQGFVDYGGAGADVVEEFDMQ